MPDSRAAHTPAKPGRDRMAFIEGERAALTLAKEFIDKALAADTGHSAIAWLERAGDEVRRVERAAWWRTHERPGD